MPENGWISLNVPLTRARTGSASTRTTHPHFLSLLTAACRAIGVTNPVINPYRLRTKGEMLADCSNPMLLARLTPASISCAHPETPRWRRQPQGNCGYCLPCLVRRAALARIGHDHGNNYAWDALTDPGLLDPAARTGADLRATVRGVSPHRMNSISSGTRPCRLASTTPISSYGDGAPKKSGPGSPAVPGPSPS